MNDTDVKINKWKKSMQDFIVNDIDKCLQQNTLEVALIILVVVGIESLSGYFAGKPADGTTFQLFVKKYFPPEYTQNGTLLYELRNHLVHDGTSEKFAFQRTIDEDEGRKQLSIVPIDGEDKRYLNRERFARDFLGAAQKFFNDVDENESLKQNILNRLLKSNRLPLIVVNSSDLQQGIVFTNGTVPMTNKFTSFDGG